MQVVEQTTPAETPTSRPRRRRVPWSLIVAGVAIAAAVLYLVVANTGATAEYYMTIKELHACTTCASRTIRVAAVVAPNSIVRDAKSQMVHFTVTDASESMPVSYSGVVPDIFGPGIQVVVEGRLDRAGVFQAQNLLAKCPSKFQSATPPPSSQ
jgi:cytochrome c-type biogenesis protein CcmE